MTDGVNRENQSPEKRKGLFSRSGNQSEASREENNKQAVHNTGEDSIESRLRGDSENPKDLSRYEKLRRFFSRRKKGTAEEETAETGGNEVIEGPPQRAAGDTSSDGAVVAGEVAQTRRAVEHRDGETVPPVKTPAPDYGPAGTDIETTAPAAEPESIETADLSPGRERPVADDLPGEPESPETPVVTEAAAEPEALEKPSPEQRFGRIRRALSKTGKGLGRVFLGKKQIDDDLLEELETQLLTADLGFEVTTEVIDALTERVRRNELNDVDALQSALRELLVEILKPCEVPLEIGPREPFVLMTVGVNGVGKTTTIGKLARLYLSEGKSAMLAAGDTFRAAAVEQLQVWGERNGVPVVAQHTGADSASVIYDAVESARARKTDLLIADTAGRLHTKSNLMDELKKIKRVLGKLDESAPHEILLVLDAGTGQNAVNQLTQFNEAVGVTGIVLTKLDGTAKGGVIFALCRKYGIPVRFIGVGETVNDLQPFRAEDFVDALLASAETAETV